MHQIGEHARCPHARDCYHGSHCNRPLIFFSDVLFFSFLPSSQRYKSSWDAIGLTRKLGDKLEKGLRHTDINKFHFIFEVSSFKTHTRRGGGAALAEIFFDVFFAFSSFLLFCFLFFFLSLCDLFLSSSPSTSLSLSLSFSFQAIDKLVLARRVLQWTYALSYYFKSGGEKSLFEYQQGLLTQATESLQDIVDASAGEGAAGVDKLLQLRKVSERREKRKRWDALLPLGCCCWLAASWFFSQCRFLSLPFSHASAPLPFPSLSPQDVINKTASIDKFRTEMVAQVERGEFEHLLLAQADGDLGERWACVACKTENEKKGAIVQTRPVQHANCMGNRIVEPARANSSRKHSSERDEVTKSLHRAATFPSSILPNRFSPLPPIIPALFLFLHCIQLFSLPACHSHRRHFLAYCL